MKDLIKSKKFKIAAIAVGTIIILLFTFSAGVLAGFKKARFSYQWGEHYEKNFMGPKPPKGPRDFMPDFQGQGFRNAHGISGNIISITDNNIILKDQNNNENTIAVTDKTLIKSRGTDLKINDLKVDSRIVVLGRPNDNGVINAELIRVFAK